LLAGISLFALSCKNDPPPAASVAVTSVSLNARTLTLEVNETFTLTPTILPRNATNTGVSWATSNAAVATVSNGVVKGIGQGDATITVTTRDGNKRATCSVTVLPGGDVEDVKLNITALTLKPGETATLLSNIIPSYATNKNVTWESGDTAVATVNEGGEVIAVASGAANITVTSSGNPLRKDVCLVTVKGEEEYPALTVFVDGITLNKSELFFPYAATQTGTEQLTAIISPSTASNKTVNWFSNNETVAEVSETGLVNAKAPGSAFIIVTTEDGGFFATCPVMVEGPEPVLPEPPEGEPPIKLITNVLLNTSAMTLQIGGEAQLEATFIPADATELRHYWRSSNPGVVTVDANGNVKAVAQGSALVIVTTLIGEKIAYCAVTVQPPQAIPVTSIIMSTGTLTFTLETEVTTATLSPLVQPYDATNKRVNWASSDRSVATVSPSIEGGVVTAVGAGTATITVTTVDGGFTAICVVTVKSPPPPPTDPDDPGDPTIYVQSVSLNTQRLTLHSGDQVTLVATVYPENADNKAFNWRSSNPAVATVEPNGLVIVRTTTPPGYANIYVTTEDGGKTAFCEITVAAPAAIPVTNVTLNTNAVTLTLGTAANTVALAPMVLPYNATIQNVSWITSDRTVATVSSGVVTAQGVGTARITVTTQDSGKTAFCDVTVKTPDELPPGNIPVISISLNIPAVTLSVNGQTTLTASILPANATNKNFSWRSTNDTVATVVNGLVTARAVGPASIYVTTEDGGKTASCNVTVAAPPSVAITSVALNKTTLDLEVGAQEQLSVTILPDTVAESNKGVAWSTSNSAVATVSNGMVTARGPGAANITATAVYGGRSATCLVTVSGELISVEVINLTDTGTPVTADTVITLEEGGGYTLSVEVLPTNASNRNLNYRSSDTDVATVSGGITSCAIVAKKEGTVTITVESDSDPAVKVTFTVKVNPPDPNAVQVDKVEVSPKNLILNIGDTNTLIAIVVPDNAANKVVRWASSAPSVAEVSDNGVVTAKTAGTATITVTALQNGEEGQCAVTVRSMDEPNIPVTGVTLDRLSLLMDIGDTPVVLTATIDPEDATDQGVDWKSSNSLFARVEPSGEFTAIVTPVGYGTALIYVTTESGGKVAFCTVTVEEKGGPVNIYVPASITLNETQLDLLTNASFTLVPTLLPTTVTPGNSVITWNTTNRAVATVSNTGQVSANAPGYTLITATTMNGRVAACAVFVNDPPPDNIPVEGITMTRSAVDVETGGSITLAVNFFPSNAKNKGVGWSSSAETIATVLQGAEPGTASVSGIKPGTVTITAISDDGDKRATCTVTVTQKADFSIKFEDIKDPNPAITGSLELSKRSTTPLVLTLTNAAQYDAIYWEVTSPNKTSDTATFTLLASDFNELGEGKYFISLEVKSKADGRWYSKTFTLHLEE
jgi:uncharacterized protein YjdB